MKSKVYRQTERELEATREVLCNLIKSAHEIFGAEANELRTTEAALKAIDESLDSSKKRGEHH